MRRRKKPGALERYLGYRENIIEKTPDLEEDKQVKALQTTVLDFIGASDLEIELGSGCSGFSLALAEQSPDKRFLAFEFKEELLLKAVEIARELGLNNIKFIRGRIEEILDYIPEGRASALYLNFSDPWPKNRHRKRRLTSEDFLELYKRVLKAGGRLDIKTDHEGLYKYSLEKLGEHGFEICEHGGDLHGVYDTVIMTEYETKYVAEGKKIKYIFAKNKNNKAEHICVSGE